MRKTIKRIAAAQRRPVAEIMHNMGQVIKKAKNTAAQRLSAAEIMHNMGQLIKKEKNTAALRRSAAEITRICD